MSTTPGVCRGSDNELPTGNFYYRTICRTKDCPRCGRTLSLEEFYRSRNRCDGRDGYCADCRKELCKSPERKRLMRACDARHRQRYPERDRARHIAGRAIRLGRIQKGPCEFKGCTNPVQAHHDDYSKPLDVRWFCRKHHFEYHLCQRVLKRELALPGVASHAA